MIPIAAILIRNPKGELFVAKRKNTKRVDPGLFGIGAGGHVEDSETPAAAAARELFEETGIATLSRRYSPSTFTMETGIKRPLV